MAQICASAATAKALDLYLRICMRPFPDAPTARHAGVKVNVHVHLTIIIIIITVTADHSRPMVFIYTAHACAAAMCENVAMRDDEIERATTTTTTRRKQTRETFDTGRQRCGY